MNQIMLFLGIYIIVINLYGFIIMGYDKYNAKKNNWRTSEKKLYIIALIGGGFGIYIGMKKFRHKTKHLSFKYGIPVLIVFNVIVYYLIITTYTL